MPNFDVWSIVRTPFPYTDRPIRQHRPALVVAVSNAKDEHGLLWVLMITSAANRGWSSDVEISDIALGGLPIPSIVRTAKIATIESGVAERIGTLSDGDRQRVRELLSEHLCNVL
ncbi:MAG: growth inhibitor PemK [Alphaproteobacteria bacterium RIFOXYD12_FULL_60_8]|nr:MAG: growth inhibitor PemK [Alphaproteobacteria bacterium RIFOXYD12_FULL_60_8]